MRRSSNSVQPLKIKKPARAGFTKCSLYQIQCRGPLRPPSFESGLCFWVRPVASRRRPTACVNTGNGTSSSPAIIFSRASVDTLSASPSASKPLQICTARRRAIMGTSEFFSRLLQRLDVCCGRAFLALRHVEGDLLAFLERLEAGALDRAVMREEILAAVIRRDESKTLRVVEPLNGTCSHCHSTCLKNVLARDCPSPASGTMFKGGNDF